MTILLRPPRALTAGSNMCGQRIRQRTCCDPVEGDDGAESGIDVARGRKHGLVECCKQGAKDDHAAGRQDIGQRPAQALAGVAQKLRQRLQVPNLQKEPAHAFSQVVAVA